MTRNDSTYRLTAIGLLVAAGAAGVYFAARAGGSAAGILAAVALASAVVLVLRIQPASADAISLTQVFDGVLLLLPGALMVYFAFDSGGYFPASPAFVAILLLFVLVLRVTLVDAPFAAFSRPLALAVVAMGLLSGWILLSGAWSNAPGRALVEFDRAFAYLLILVLFGSVARSSSRLRWMAAGLALGTVVIAVAALATRLAPDHFPTRVPTIGPQSLTYPLTYANALAIVCVFGVILSLYFATSVRQPVVVRILGSAALPILSVTVYLTLARGPVAAGIAGIVAFAILGRPRGLLTGLIATVPTSAIAVASAYQHPLLTSKFPTSVAAAHQGHKVIVVVVVCVVGAALLRLVLTPFDERLAEFHLPERSRRPVIAACWALALIIVLAVFFAAHGPSRVSDQYHKFVKTGQTGPNQDLRANLFNPSNRGIVDNWSVGLHAFRDSPLHGQGAGAYEVYWNQHRPAKEAGYEVTDGHSLYVETLGELGLVGFLLLAAVILAVLISLLPVRRGANRPLYAALFAVALAWAIHTGIDWDWEMPAVTAVFFALGGAGLAAHQSTISAGFTPSGARVTVGLLLLLSTVAPGLILASQQRLNDSYDALRAGNCTKAVDRASASISTLSVRPEPYEVLALCQSKRGRPGFGIEAIRKAVQYDPDNWRYHYDLAVLQGGAGLDPRPELEEAHRLNPTRAEVTGLLATVPKGQAVSWQTLLLGPGGATGAVLGNGGAAG
jgi:O-Antigen ligase